MSPWDRLIERKIEAALVDWFRREGWEVDHDFIAIKYISMSSQDYVELSIAALARYIADEIKS